ncbi:MAG: Xylose isomerase-like barrel [Chthoniobacter sp.]|nr:Xylose isomerase-like barrel [Chthoniobacter sp.]
MSELPPALSRRAFISTAVAAGAALSLDAIGQTASAPRFRIAGFTKPFQSIGYEHTAEVVAEIGWSGIECPVRLKGQVEPERVADELPKLHAALKSRGLDLDIVTTDIVGVSTPFAEQVLRTAKQLGCSRYRLGFFRYKLDQPIAAQLANLKAGLRDLAALNKELGMRGGIQNHSGATHLGCAVWDIHELVRDLDPTALGICFDIGHGTLEGGTSWPIEARLMEPFFAAVFVKDFLWQRGAKGFAPVWGPLGDGMVRREFFDWLKKSSFEGPISQHVEYISGAGPEQIAIMKKDCATLKSWLGA